MLLEQKEEQCGLKNEVPGRKGRHSKAIKALDFTLSIM